MASVKHNRLKLTNLPIVTSDTFLTVSDFAETQKLIASDTIANKRFGVAVSLDSLGNTAIIGAEGDSTFGTNSGAAYIFAKNSSDVWSQKQKIVGSDISTLYRFGQSVSIDSAGNTVIVGAAKSSGTLTTGKAYFFTKNSSDVWSQKQKIEASDQQLNNSFGTSVSINSSGTIAVVGAPRAVTATILAGAAYIFTKDASDIWNEKQRIVGSDYAITAGIFGNAVSLDSTGNTIMVADTQNDTGGGNAGAVHIFIKDASDIWNETQTIQSSDVEANDNFGQSLFMNPAGNTAIISAHREDTGYVDAGAAYIFTKNSSDVWSQKQKIQASDRQADDRFGISVAINAFGNVAVIGSEREDTGSSDAGSTYIFTKNSSDIWSQIQKIQASDRSLGSNFGSACSINGGGDIVVVGAVNDSAIALGAGAAYPFKAVSIEQPVSDGSIYNELPQGMLYVMQSDLTLRIKI